MRIAINTSPLESLHAGRGIGQYTSLLLNALKQYDKKNEYLFFTKELNTTTDIIHYPFFDIFNATLKLTKGTKTIVTVHDLIPVKYPDKFPSGIRGKVGWWRQKNTLKSVNAIITDSEASAKDIVMLTKISRDNIHVVPLPVSSEYKKLSQTEIKKLDLDKYDLPQKFILYVGDINWNKNIPGLLKAFSRIVKKKEYANTYLVLVGSAFLKADIPETQEINKIILEEKIAEHVRRVGFVPIDELVGIYNLSALYVQPSFDEGFGLGLLQAMTCGIPVVSSNRGSLPEVGGQVIEYFDPTKVEDQVKVLERALGYSVSEQKKKVEQVLQLASKFTAKKLAEQTIQVYEQAVKTP